jgi:hypothetical protein
MAHRAGVSKVGLNRVQWVDIDSTVDSVCGAQEGATKVNFRPTALLTNQPRFEIFFYGIAESPKRIGAPKFIIE